VKLEEERDTLQLEARLNAAEIVIVIKINIAEIVIVIP
jgi:uncharacterized protein with PIN domain